ncbi:binding-protein-dependent transport systems inner membrane component [Planctopirus limnophila DSM 3776]|uniref:Binding-protein-dependent transport systems inner membrane component n=1 Tax=Planctopirus limnophila (strain ATCC 43296 / DSM 3776 / IFAM 1008 / Mu 290) TaxID=521674 RepID=D5SVG8_PLAL2|nr:ABC transporter permease [Planctopirus limnophila]ADG67238.1 binding-protein-dependent transport systems inner membrane component [Planctopirus limnophila DSM 3776]
MATYIFRRLLLMIPTLFGILVLSFIVIKSTPGDPASGRFGGAAAAQGGMNAERGTEDAEKAFRKNFKLDEPLYVQFFWFVGRIFRGEMIYYTKQGSIWPDLIPAMKITLMINSIVFLLVYLLAIPMGIFSATAPHSTGDRIMTLTLFVLYSLPSFWVAEMLRLGVLESNAAWNAAMLSQDAQEWMFNYPISGLHDVNADRFSLFQWLWDYTLHLVLPILCMTYASLAYISRQMRAGMLEVVRQDYIRTAKAKGCSPARVIWVHALRNSLFPIITLFASLLPALIGGSVIIEYIFNIPGMGKLTIDSVFSREYDMILVTMMLSAVLTLIGILISDIMYVLVDPRVSFESKN